jgi:hypothetical protein
VNLLVDTSVWSLALRRDAPTSRPEVAVLRQALEGTAPVFTTGLILQELLQGFRGPRARGAILARFSALPFLVPDRRDHLRAAELHSACRRKGVPVGTIDALLAELCVRYKLTMLSTDTDFRRIATVRPLLLWGS